MPVAAKPGWKEKVENHSLKNGKWGVSFPLKESSLQSLKRAYVKLLLF